MPIEKRRILCVDGSSDTCEQLRLILGKEEFETKNAETVQEAVRIITWEHFDLFIIEQSFKDGTGIALCKMLRSYAPASPVIFYTEDRNEPRRSEALEAGAVERLYKDRDFDKLTSLVRSFLS